MSFLDRIKAQARNERTSFERITQSFDDSVGADAVAVATRAPASSPAAASATASATPAVDSGACAVAASATSTSSAPAGRPSAKASTAKSEPSRAAPNSRLEPAGPASVQPSVFRNSRLPSDGPASSQFAASRLPDGSGLGAALDTGLPLIGKRSFATQQRWLVTLIVAGLLGLALSAAAAWWLAQQHAAQVAGVAAAQVQSQRLAKAVTQAVAGTASAFPEVRESVDGLVRQVRALGSAEVEPAVMPAGFQEAVDQLVPMVTKAEKHASAVLAQQRPLTQLGQSLAAVNRQSPSLLETAEAVAAQKAQSGAGPAEMAAVTQLVMWTQRIAKNANEFFNAPGPAAAAALLQMDKDLAAFKETTLGVINGSPEMRLPGTRDAATRERLQSLLDQQEQLRTEAAPLLANVQSLASARDAQQAILNDSEPLRRGLEALQQRMAGGGAWNNVVPLAGALLSLLMLAAGGFGLGRLVVRDQARRSRVVDQQRQEAQRQEQEAKRVNDSNQNAILRLMNELQTVAEGDLTQQATVTEDITGAIADSVNYTVEELRTLVSQVKGTASRVTDTTLQVEQTSTELLAASTEQLREIRETGESVLQMAGRITDVSGHAQRSADVARQSLAASASGLKAVQNSIGGMSSIREQIQETSKRIKRLGESSQEIGEITELISDITEQTNVLALNAAIQAASAGEAGRGFSVVAEEVQRLAERSGDATRQIAAIVRAIQTDTQDAMAAMERSTQGVVEGTRLSDNAGAALGDIDRVTHELAELIGRISAEASREAELANGVAQNIQHIFAVTEQTSEGTRSTAQMVRELMRSADELRASVARFKVA